jgi:subtilisin family serine protease
MPVRIAVIDTGIDPTHRWLNGCVVGGVGIEGGDGAAAPRFTLGTFGDVAGHGTNMASLIHAFCPKAELMAVRIAACYRPVTRDGDRPFGETPYVEMGVSETVLAEAIHWCIDNKISIMNISYSLESVEPDGSLEKACREAFDRGAIVVSSYRNGQSEPTYPAAFPTVIGVRRARGLAPGQLSIVSAGNRDVAGWGGPVHGAHLRDTISYSFGTSQACALVSAMVGRMKLVDDGIGPEGAFAYLQRISAP